MINKISIRGFENHLDTVLKFINGINIITGVTNAGKSSIIKAVNWIVSNDPQGNGFIYNKAKIPCIVDSAFDDIEIRKYKDETTHYYKINDNEYTALKGNMPDQIKEITKFSDMNIQNQFDRFFLLQDSSGEVARKLNEIIDLAIMDRVVKKAKSKVYKKNRDIEYLKVEVNDLKNDLQKYDWIDNVGHLFFILEELAEKKEKIDQKIIKLSEFKIQHKEITNKINIINKKLSIKSDFSSIKCEFDVLKDINNRLKELKSIDYTFESINSQLFQYEDIDNQKKVLSNVKKDYKLLCGINDQLKLLKSYQKTNDKLIIIDKDLDRLQKKHNKLLPIGSICPVCKNKIKE